MPLDFDNQSIFKERFYLDKTNPRILHDEITVIDHALTRPWTVDKTYRRNPNPHPSWTEYYCAEGNHQVVLGKENHFPQRGLAADADQEGPGPAGFALLQADTEVKAALEELFAALRSPCRILPMGKEPRAWQSIGESEKPRRLPFLEDLGNCDGELDGLAILF